MQEGGEAATAALSVVDIAHVLQANYAFISGMFMPPPYHQYFH